jgi:hypothetical protein
VAGVGDIDGDGFSDLLIAAQGELGGRGVVYMIYGSPSLPATVSLASLSPKQVDVLYLRITGSAAGDALGGGLKVVAGTDPFGGSTTVRSQGLAGLGDLDGDGAGDFAISAMLADPAGRTDAGEVYVVYGVGGP